MINIKNKIVFIAVLLVVLFLTLPIVEPRSVSSVFTDFFDSFHLITGLISDIPEGEYVCADLGGECYQSVGCQDGYASPGINYDHVCYSDDKNAEIGIVDVSGEAIRKITGKVYLDWTCCVETCGNDVIDSGEDCDGSELDGASCSSEGYASGSLSCGNDCQFSFSQCRDCDDDADCGDGYFCDDGECTFGRSAPVCGNSQIDINEECDNLNLNSKTCGTQGFYAGTLSCSNCLFDTSLCTGKDSTDPNLPSTCNNNGIIEGNEQCDGSDFGGETCYGTFFKANIGLNSVADLNSAVEVGDLICTKECKIDRSDCQNDPWCGNNLVDSSDEQCDGRDLNGQRCRSFGISSSDSLVCNDECKFVLESCIDGENPEKPSDLTQTIDQGSCGDVDGICMNYCIPGFTYFSNVSLDLECQQEFSINSLVCCVRGESLVDDETSDSGLDISQELKEALENKEEQGTVEEPSNFDVNQILTSPKMLGGIWILFVLSVVVIVVSTYLHKKLVHKKSAKK